MDALERMTDTQLARSPLFYPLRDRVAFGLCLLLGPRVTAIADVRRSHYRKDHAGVPPDYRGGAVIVLYPGKGVDSDVPRPRSSPGRSPWTSMCTCDTSSG